MKGSLFRRPGRKVYMCAFMGPKAGKWIRRFESTGCENRKDAKAVLDKRIAEATAWRNGTQPEQIDTRKLTVKSLLDALRDHYTGSKSEEQSSFRIDRLEEEFGAVLVTAMTPQRIREWRDGFRRAGAAPATANRWIELLRRAFTLAVEDGRLPVAPKFPSKLPEPGGRTGFVDESDVEKLVANLDPMNGLVVQFLFATGWRKSEALGLRWENISKGEIRISTSKNGEGRAIPLAGDLKGLIGRLRLLRTYGDVETRSVSPYVFHRDGQPLHRNTFGVAFRNAAVAAGLGDWIETGYVGLLVHDLRRSTARRTRHPERDRRAPRGERPLVAPLRREGEEGGFPAACGGSRACLRSSLRRFAASRAPASRETARNDHELRPGSI